MKAFISLLCLTAMVVGCSRNSTSLSQTAASAISHLSNTNQSRASTPILVAQFSPDGKQIVTTTKDGNVRLWDPKTGQALSLTNGAGVQVWDIAKGKPLPRRYQPDRPDDMPVVGPDNFQRLQDQIDALERRVQELEKNANKTGR